jgi:hypothetical protein
MIPKFLVIALGVAFAKYPRGDKPLRPAFLLILAASVVSALFSDSPLLSFWSRPNSASHGVPGILLIYLCYEAASKSDEREEYSCVEWGAFICAIVAVLQGAGIVHSPIPGRATGTIGAPPFMSCLLALALPFTLREKRWVMATAIIAAVWFSHSRAGMAGIAAGAAALYLPWRISALALALPAALIAGTLGTAGTLIHAQGDSMRLHIWQTALKAFWQRPIFGWGIEGFGDAFIRLRPREWADIAITTTDSGHNFILSALAYGGIANALSLAYLGYLAYRRRPSRTLLASTTAVLAYGLFNPIPFTAFCVLAYLWGCEDA